MTRRITDAYHNRLVFGFRFGKCFFAPGKPINGIVRVLLQIRTRLVYQAICKFWDEEAGGFYFTANNHEDLLMRSKDYYDNATPAGNSAAADVLLKLSKLTNDEKYERYSITVLRLVAPQIRRYSQAFGRVLSTLEFHLNPTKEIVIIGEKGNELEREVWRDYLPNKVVVLSNETETPEIPLLENRIRIDGKTTAYVCENFVCQKPVFSMPELKAHLTQN